MNIINIIEIDNNQYWGYSILLIISIILFLSYYQKESSRMNYNKLKNIELY
jgi:hypothetical protein